MGDGKEWMKLDIRWRNILIVEDKKIYMEALHEIISGIRRDIKVYMAYDVETAYWKTIPYRTGESDAAGTQLQLQFTA